MSDSMDATEAKNRFGQLLENAGRAPVRIRKNGRDVAVVMSIEDFEEMAAMAQGASVSPAVKALHQKSARKWAKVYEALAR